MTIMSKHTRRSFLKTTTVSAACLSLIKAFPSTTHTSPEERTPSGTVAVHLTAGDKRYSPSSSLTWQSAGRARTEDTIVLQTVHTNQPILGFGAAFTDAACYVLNQLPKPERERLLQELLAQTSEEFPLNPAYRRAANDAVSLAWVTPFPLLFLPVLLEEKAMEARRRMERQRTLLKRTAKWKSVA